MSQTTENQPWTIKRLLEWTSGYLSQNGSGSGRLDAEILLAQSLGCQRIDLYTRFDQIPANEQLTQYRGLVKQRAGGTPVAYLVGHREFFSLSFKVNKSVLIPRPETEMLVIKTLDLLKARPNKHETVQLIDVGTGSGNIAIAIAKHWQHCRIQAIDISDDALAVARENASQHKVSDRLDFVKSDLFENIDAARQFDFVISNPPYIAIDDPEVAPDVKNHEPQIALFAGNDGMEVIARLVLQAAKFLKPGGYLLFEISPFIEIKCRELLDSTDEFEKIEVLNDIANLPRVTIARRK